MAQPTSIRMAIQALRPLLQRTQRQTPPSSFLYSCRRSITSKTTPKSSTSILRRKTPAPGRLLSTSEPRQATVVLKNPRVDDEGHDMKIEISERAAKRLKQITTTPPPKNTLVPSSSSSSAADSHLRVTVTSGGCHGFQYLMSLEGPSKIDAEEDTIFAATPTTTTTAAEGGQERSSGGGEGEVGGGGEIEDKGKAQVVMDQASLELLKGSTIDFTTELIGSQFKIVGNPRATSSCGCGTSFDIE